MYDQYAAKIKPLATYKKKDKKGTYVVNGSLSILLAAWFFDSLLVLAIGIIAVIFAIIYCTSVDRAKKDAIKNMPQDLAQAKQRMELAKVKLEAAEKLYKSEQQ